MNPKLLIISLFCSACTIKGQGTDNTESYAEEISVGNFKVVFNDELSKLVSRYLITENEIKQMLERYAEGGTATITKVHKLDFKKFISEYEKPKVPVTPEQWKNRVFVTVGNLQIRFSDELRTIMRDYLLTPTQMQHMLERYAKSGAAIITKRVNLNLKEFITKRPIGPIISVSSTTDPFPGGASKTIDSRPQHHLDRILSKVVDIQKQIKLLDEERKALNDFYRHGIITIQTRNENLMRNRIDRSVLETNLQVLQTDIRRRTRSEPVVQINYGDDDEELFES